MTTVPREVQEDFDFAVARHLGRPAVTYAAMLAADWPDWCAIETIEHDVARGVLRWVAALDQSARDAFAEDLLSSINTYIAWADFKDRLWDAMDARDWLRPWDCWTSQGDLWQAALIEVFHTINHHFHPSEYVTRQEK